MTGVASLGNEKGFGSGSVRIRMFLPGPDPDPHKFADSDPGQKGKERNE